MALKKEPSLSEIGEQNNDLWLGLDDFFWNQDFYKEEVGSKGGKRKAKNGEKQLKELLSGDTQDLYDTFED